MKSKLLVAAILFSAVIGVSFLVAAKQKIEVPAIVKEAFNTKFPNAAKVKWEKENETEYEAEFKISGKKMSANFKADGTWTETEMEIAKKDLPAAVSAAIQAKFAGYKIEEVEMVETPDSGKAYEVELEMGESTIEAVFSADGQLLKQKTEEEDDDQEND